MEITVDLKSFRRAFGLAMRYTPQGKTAAAAIYRGVKLIVGDGLASLRAHDTASGVGLSVPVPVGRAAGTVECMIPGGTMSSILASAAGESITLTLNGRDLAVEAGRSRYKLNTESAEAFADPVAEVFGPAFKLAGDVFARLVDLTRHAIDPGITQWALGGMNVTWDSSVVTLGSTDGRMIIRAWADLAATPDRESHPDIQRVIPAPAAILLAGTFADSPEVEVRFAGSRVVVGAGGTVASARMLHGKFPDHLPTSCTGIPVGTAHPVDPADFRLALEQTTAVMGDTSNACRFRFAPGRITLRAVDANSGSAEVELDAPWEGPEVDLSFVPARVLAVLKSLAGSPVSISVASGEYRTLSISAPGFASWLMPYVEG